MVHHVVPVVNLQHLMDLCSSRLSSIDVVCLGSIAASIHRTYECLPRNNQCLVHKSDVRRPNPDGVSTARRAQGMGESRTRVQRRIWATCRYVFQVCCCPHRPLSNHWRSNSSLSSVSRIWFRNASVCFLSLIAQSCKLRHDCCRYQLDSGWTSA